MRISFNAASLGTALAGRAGLSQDKVKLTSESAGVALIKASNVPVSAVGFSSCRYPRRICLDLRSRLTALITIPASGCGSPAARWSSRAVLPGQGRRIDGL